MKVRASAIIFFTCLFCLAARADLPPDVGYILQSVSVTIQTQEDLSDYRFFIESPMRIEEISIEKGKPTVVNSDGRVGAARVGALWAIPRKDIGSDFDFSSTEKLQGLRQALDQGQYHAMKIITLDFRAAIREADKEDWQDPVYQLNKNPDGIAASLVSGTVLRNANRGAQLYSTEPKSASFWIAVFVGSGATLLFIVSGALALRRSKIRATEGGEFIR